MGGLEAMSVTTLNVLRGRMTLMFYDSLKVTVDFSLYTVYVSADVRAGGQTSRSATSCPSSLDIFHPSTLSVTWVSASMVPWPRQNSKYLPPLCLCCPSYIRVRWMLLLLRVCSRFKCKTFATDGRPVRAHLDGSHRRSQGA